MANITTRAGKGSPLTNAEVDANFTNLNTAVIDAAATATWAGVTGKPATLAGYGITDAQPLLVSGTSIKTVNGQSVLGSGNIQIDGGVTSFNTRTGDVTLNQYDVLDALGYLPYGPFTPVITAAGLVVDQNANTFTFNNATVLNSFNYQFYAPTTSGQGAFGTWDISITGGAAFLTGTLTSSQITDGLGYTPYDSTNPSGYITSAFSGFMLRSSSPQANPNTNFSSSAYRFDPNANNPTNEHYAILTYGNEGNVTGQLATHFVSGQTFTRAYNSAWSAWRTQLDSSNYSSYALPLSGGDMSGRIRMGTFSNSQNNTGEAWIGRASDRATGTMTVQLGNSADRVFEVVDSPWSTVIFAAGMNSFTYKGSAILHAGNVSSYAAPVSHTHSYLPLSGGTLTGSLILPANYDLSWGGSYGTGKATLSAGAGGIYLYATGNSSGNTFSFTPSANNSVVALQQGGNQVLHAGNYSSYALPLSGGTVSGTVRINGQLQVGQNTNGTAIIDAFSGIARFGRDSSAYGLQLDGNNYASFVNANGYVNIGPLNSSYSHFQTDRPQFYFNKDVHVDGQLYKYNGGAYLHSGNYNNYSPTLTGGNASGTWGINITGNAGSVNSKTSTAFHQRVHYSTSAGNSGFYKIRILAATSWMLSFTIRIYQGYQSHDIRVSGYNYGGNYWYSPQASLMDSSATSIDVRFGYDSAYNLWVAVPADAYTGLDVLDVVNGYTQIDGNYADQFAIQHQTSLTGTVQTVVTAYRPLKYNETATAANLLNLGAHTISSSSWAGGGGYHGYQFNGGNWRFGFSSTGGVVDVYADGNFYATDSSHLVLHAGNFGSYALPLSGGTLSGSIYAPNFISTANNNYGIFSTNAYFDTVNGRGSDPLELNYYDGGPVKIGSGTNGSKSLYAVGIYDNGNQVLHAGNFSSYATARTSAGRPGVTKLYRNESDDPYNVQTTWSVDASGYWSLRGFYDNSYHAPCYVGLSGLSFRANRANGNFYIDDNFGNTLVGVYNASRYQGVFAMGDAYKLPADGTSTGGLYGMAWSHPNAGGAAGNLTDHGLLIINNGVFKCAISNSIVASSNITAYSDERLKTNWRDLPENFVARLAKVKVGIYDRLDEENVTQVGVSAQSFQELLPQAIMTAKDEMGTLSVSYGNAALASAVELAKDNVELRARIERLEALVEKLIGD